MTKDNISGIPIADYLEWVESKGCKIHNDYGESLGEIIVESPSGACVVIDDESGEFISVAQVEYYDRRLGLKSLPNLLPRANEGPPKPEGSK